jgi:hypothetical protein
VQLTAQMGFLTPSNRGSLKGLFGACRFDAADLPACGTLIKSGELI